MLVIKKLLLNILYFLLMYLTLFIFSFKWVIVVFNFESAAVLCKKHKIVANIDNMKFNDALPYAMLKIIVCNNVSYL